MNQSLISVGLFIVLLAAVPIGLKWIQRRSAGVTSGIGSASKVISAIGVGPHQHVITVEVGPEGSRTWLTLGVTAQSITCLHCVAVDVKPERALPPVLHGKDVIS